MTLRGRLKEARARFHDRLPARWRLTSMENPLVAGGLTVLFVSAISYLLLAPYGVETVQLRLNEIAKRDYRATHTFECEVPDPEATQRAREQASRVPRVYRHDPKVRERALMELDKVFVGLRTACEGRREALEELRQRHTAEHTALTQMLEDAPPNEQQAIATKLQELRSRHADEVSRRLKETDAAIARSRSEALRQVGGDVSPQVLDTLLTVCFPEALQSQGASLLGWVLEWHIVAEKAELLTEIDRGISIAVPGRDELLKVQDFRDVRSQAEARRKLAAAVTKRFAELNEPAFFDNSDVEVAFRAFLASFVVPNTSYDAAATRAEREKARAESEKMRTETFLAGQIIVREGQVVGQEQIDILEQMQTGVEEITAWRRLAAVAILAVLLLAIVYTFGRYHLPAFPRPGRDIVFASVLMLFELGSLRLHIGLSEAMSEAWDMVPLVAFYFLFPFPMGAMFLRQFVNTTTAVLYAMLLALFVGIMLDPVGIPQFQGSAPLYLASMTLIGSLIGIASMKRIRRRAVVLRAGLLIGLGCMGMAVGFHLLNPAALDWHIGMTALGAFFGGIASALLVVALTPVIEWAFGYTTDVRLLELASLDHPLLKRLILEAPGTYHHSFLVASLVESAAESVGANPLLARVAAMYHDVGKLKNPLYFAENQRRGENRHDKLLPSMSALVIRAHVKDGVRMAEEHHLGREIRDIIEQHHGTTLIRFFYDKAVAGANGADASPAENDFRYPGPRPQSKEAALVLLADAAEASVRSLPEKSPSRIQGMVQRAAVDKFLDGQLDQCDLSLRDLHAIETVFTTVLQGVYHARPEYPARNRATTTTQSAVGPGPS